MFVYADNAATTRLSETAKRTTGSYTKNFIRSISTRRSALTLREKANCGIFTFSIISPFPARKNITKP